MKLLFFALAFVFQLAAFADHHGKKPLKALMITGGCCHDYKKQKNIIKQFIGFLSEAIVLYTLWKRCYLI